MAPTEEDVSNNPVSMSIGEVVQERERDLRSLQEENLELKMIIYLLKQDFETRLITHEADMNVLRTRLTSEATTNKSLRWQIIELKCAAEKEKLNRQGMKQYIASIEDDMQEAHRTTDRVMQKIQNAGSKKGKEDL